MNFTRERYGWWFIESLEGAHELTFYTEQVTHYCNLFVGFVPAPRPDRHTSFLPFAPCSGE